MTLAPRLPAPIADYALIGDCETAALVSREGSIDWLCWPRFDSEACFAALLGQPSNGRWLIRPTADPVVTRRRYRPDTLVLETTIETHDGAVTLVDFMQPRGRSSDLIRLVRGEHGTVAMCLELVLRFGYGATIPWVTRLDNGAVRAFDKLRRSFPTAGHEGASRSPAPQWSRQSPHCKKIKLHDGIKCQNYN